MRNLKPVAQHKIQHIWEQYAKEYLIKHPECFGKYHNKIKNYYIFKVGTKSRTVRLRYKNSISMPKDYSMAGLVLSYATFRKIIEVYLKKVILEVVAGNAVKLNSLGKICMIRAERDFRKTNQLKVDWGKTRKQEKVWNEEKQKMMYPKRIYFTDDHWCRVNWVKSAVTNISVYEFQPTLPNGPTGGFIGEVTRQLKVNPLLKYLYLYRPIKDSKEIKKHRFKKQVQ